MSLIEKIQAKSQAEKIRLIWIITIIIVAALILVWIISEKFLKKPPADTTLFQTMGQGINDIRENFKK